MAPIPARGAERRQPLPRTQQSTSPVDATPLGACGAAPARARCAARPHQRAGEQLVEPGVGRVVGAVGVELGPVDLRASDSAKARPAPAEQRRPQPATSCAAAAAGPGRRSRTAPRSPATRSAGTGSCDVGREVVARTGPGNASWPRTGVRLGVTDQRQPPGDRGDQHEDREGGELAFHRRFLPEITLSEMNALADDWFPEANRLVVVSAPEVAGRTLPTGVAACVNSRSGCGQERRCLRRLRSRADASWSIRPRKGASWLLPQSTAT